MSQLRDKMNQAKLRWMRERTPENRAAFEALQADYLRAVAGEPVGTVAPAGGVTSTDTTPSVDTSAAANTGSADSEPEGDEKKN